MVEWRLEWESKNTEMVQYIGNGKVETETEIWNQTRSARELKWNNKNQNVIGGLGDWLGFLEDKDIVLGFSGNDSVVSEISEVVGIFIRGVVGD